MVKQQPAAQHILVDAAPIPFVTVQLRIVETFAGGRSVRLPADNADINGNHAQLPLRCSRFPLHLFEKA
jgi:hypothetical protein